MPPTVTAVHDEASRAAQQRQETRYENELMLATAITAQLLSFGALYLLPAAATASWIAALLQLPALLLMRLLGYFVRRTAPPAAALTLPYRLAAGLQSLLFLSNMAVCLLTLIELTHVFFFPRSSRLLLSLAAALALGLGMPRAPTAVPNAVRLLRWFLLAAFAFCAATVLPTGEVGYLFPLAGYGMGHTLRCAVTAVGSVWMAGALAVASPNDSPCRSPRALLPSLGSVVLVSLLFLCCALVLPGTELSSRWGYALRLQLLMEMSPNTLSWSLMLMAEMLLFLEGFTVCAELLRKSLTQALRLRRPAMLPFALCCVPLAVRGMGESEALLLRLLPWRYPAAVLALLLCLGCNLAKRRKKS